MSKSRTLTIILILIAIMTSKLPIYANLPLDLITIDGELLNPSELKATFTKLKDSGIDGIIADVWWRTVEKSPKNYDFSAYNKIVDLSKENNLKVKFILSFHDCKSTYGDICDIPLPSWVTKEDNHGIFYTDSNGTSSKSYISLFADDLRVFGDDNDKRTPIEMYTDFMINFRTNFQLDLNLVIDEVYIGLGPSGQLRYPAYRVDMESYCGVGDFQHYDENALKQLQEDSEAYNNYLNEIVYSNSPRRNFKGNLPFNVKVSNNDRHYYQRKPDETTFFQSPTVSCDVHPFQKQKCEANTESQCIINGCCWDANSDIKCFKKAVNFCSSEKKRTDCGVIGTKKDECIAKGCCWDESKPYVPFCFHSETAETYQTSFGQFFLNWYENKLYKHGERLTNKARTIFKNLPISIKLPSVFWMNKDPSRAARPLQAIITQVQPILMKN